MSFDPKDFRRALGKFATGVTVVTTVDDNNERLGVTASSFNSVSIDPPLILWSVDKSAYSAAVFARAEHFAVNVLANNQIEVSNRFARRGEDKFAGVGCSEGIGKAPKIDGAVACFECRTWQVYEGGDHHIIVGEVVGFQYDESKSSLVFHNGRYAVPAQHPVTKELDPNKAVDGLLGKSLIYLLRQAYASASEAFYPSLSNYGVTAEEWRVLTLLCDRGPMAVDAVGAIVMQPTKALHDTIAWLGEKGFVEQSADGTVGLSAAGVEIAHRLLAMAHEFERKMLDSLSEAQIKLLQDQLRQIAQA